MSNSVNATTAGKILSKPSRVIMVFVLLLLAMPFFAISPKQVAATGLDSCTNANEYGGTITSATIKYPGGTLDALAHPGLNITVPSSSTYNVTFTIHTNPRSEQNNTGPGSLWYSRNTAGSSFSTCYPNSNTPSTTVGPSKNVTITVTGISEPRGSSGYKAPYQSLLWYMHTGRGNVNSSFGYNVYWKPSPDFTLSNPTVELSSPQSSLPITITSLNGFSGVVLLNLASITPSIVGGIGVSYNPQSVTVSAGGSATSTIQVQSSSATPPGIYSLTIKGTSGTLSRSAYFNFEVPDFNLSLFSQTVTVPMRGVTNGTAIELNSLYGFSGTISMSINPSPPVGMTLSVSPTVVTLQKGQAAGVSLYVNANSPSLQAGTYHFTLQATTTIMISPGPGSGIATTYLKVKTAPLTIIVAPQPAPPAIQFSANPTSITVPAGSASSTVLTVKSLNGFTGPVSFSVSSEFVPPCICVYLPPLVGSAIIPGIAVSPNNSTLILPSSGSNASLTIKVSPDIAMRPGLYGVALKVANTGSSIATYAILSITVTPSPSAPIFALTDLISSSPPIAAGSQFSTSLDLKAVNGFKGQVTVSLFGITSTTAGVTPSGISVTPLSNTTQINSNDTGIPVTILTSNSTQPGTYSVKFEATNPGSATSSSTSITLTVTAPPPPPFNWWGWLSSSFDNPTDTVNFIKAVFDAAASVVGFLFLIGIL